MDARRAARDARTTDLVTGVGGPRCESCNAPLAPDQRYCVSCGESRGKSRVSYETAAAHAAATPSGPAAEPSGRPRFSSGTTLVAGVATLLIALGVGVLIGHSSNSGIPVRAAAPQVISVGGGAGAGAAGTNGADSGGSATLAARGKASKTKVTRVVLTGKSAKAASNAAAKVFGSGRNLTKNLQQQVGGSCSGGAGCQNGTFTGNFFPGG